MNLSTGDANEEGGGGGDTRRRGRRSPPPQTQGSAEGQGGPSSSSAAPFASVPLSTSPTPLVVPISTSIQVATDPSHERLEHKFRRRGGDTTQGGFAIDRNPLLASESTTATAGGDAVVASTGKAVSSTTLKKREPTAAAAAASGVDPAMDEDVDVDPATAGAGTGPAAEGTAVAAASSASDRRRRRRASQAAAGPVPAAGPASSQSEAIRIRQQPQQQQVDEPTRPTLSSPLLPQLVEADFYRNPTLLSRLLLNQKYKVAMGRLKRHPEEARIVVVASRTAPIHPSSPLSSSTVSIRQLPIHLACINLGRTADPALRDVLNQLIAHLVVTFPEGCYMADHVNVLPIQYAVRHGAQASTVSLLLMAAPETLECTDGHRRTLSQLNKASDSPHRKHVSQVLKLDVEFWRQSRQEANFRLQQQQQGQGQGQQVVAAPSQLPPPSSSAGPNPMPTPSSSDVRVEPIAWEQLEIRAIALEQILNEMNEKNYTLHRRIEHLVENKMELLDHLGRLKQSTLANETRRLQKQNLALHRQLSDMRDRLRQSSSIRVGRPAPEGPDAASVPADDEEKHEIGATPVVPRPHRTESESSSLVGHSPLTPSTPGADNDDALHEYELRSTPEVRLRRSESQSSSLVGHSPLTPPSPGSAADEAAESMSTRTSTRALQTRSLQADNLKLIQANHELRNKYERLHREYKAQQRQLNKLVQLIRRLSKDTATVLLAGVSASASGRPDDPLEGDDRASRHTQKSHVSTLSGSPLTRSEDSSISESAQLKARSSRHREGQQPPHPSAERRRHHHHHHHHHHQHRPLIEDSRSSSAVPRRQRTIEIQWHSASTGLGPSADSFREREDRRRRGGRRPAARDDAEEKMEEYDDDEHEMEDNLSVLFARAIDHEASLPFAPISPIAASAPTPSSLSSPRRGTYPRPTSAAAGTTSPAAAEDEEVFTTPPSSPVQATGAGIAPSGLDDLRIPALLDVAGGGGGGARSSTPPMSL